MRVLKNRLPEIREKRNLTQQDLALSIGITRGSISRFEREKTQPALFTAIELAEFLNLKVEDIFYIEDI